MMGNTEYGTLDTAAFVEEIAALIAPDIHPLSSLANIAAHIYSGMDDILWAGFYLLHHDMLVLGPFQGTVACTRIAPSRGVCGAAFSQSKSLLVPDVHAFPGHIACDARSRSELVVPLCHAGKPVGVLDLDSESLSRFTDADLARMEAVAHCVEQHLDFAGLSFHI